MNRRKEERSKVVLAVEKLLPAYLSESVTNLEILSVAEELTDMLPDNVLDEFIASGNDDILDNAIPRLLTLVSEKRDK